MSLYDFMMTYQVKKPMKWIGILSILSVVAVAVGICSVLYRWPDIWYVASIYIQFLIVGLLLVVQMMSE